MIYLDNSATTRQYDEVTAQMVRCMEEEFGNPSSLYSLGITAEKRIKESRKAVLQSMGREKDEGKLYFTSGGTEADNMAIFGAAEARQRRGKRIVTSAVEHPAVLEACHKLEQQGFEVITIGVDENCRLKMEQLKTAIDENTILITIMQVNNETGAIFPIDEIAELKKEHTLLHSDCVQSFGKVTLPAKADLISLSGHKIHGPKGVGALFIKNGIHLPPFLVGGGQEEHMRSGTENVPAIAGFGTAASIAAERRVHRIETMKAVKKYLRQGLKDQVSDILFNGPEEGSPSVLNVSFLGTRAEVLLHTLEQDEIYISTGSACSSNKKGQSHVLKAMGRKDREIEGAIRFSFNEFNTVEEMDIVLDRVKSAVSRFRKLGSFR